MAKAFDITKLAAVRARTSVATKVPGPQTPGQHHDDDDLDLTRRVALCFKQGDYELYKQRQQQKNYQCCCSHYEQDDDEASSCSCTTTATTESSCCCSQAQACESLSREVERKVFENQRLIHEYRQAVLRQEAKIDALYAQLSRAQRNVLDLRHARQELVDNLSTVVVNVSNQNVEKSSWFQTFIKLAMLGGLLARWAEGSSLWLAIAVFGWWMNESLY